MSSVEVTEGDQELANVAASGLGDIGQYDEPGNAAQPAMIPEGVVFKFVGVQYQQTDVDLKLGQEVEFVLKGRVTGKGVELMADGHERDNVRISVDSVTPAGT